jgi:hypothetical protein
MLWIALGVVLLVALLAFVVWRTRASKPVASGEAFSGLGLAAVPAARAAPTRAAPAWGKRLVVDDPSACRTARILAGQSFTLDRLPGLPLKDCTYGACRCRFEPVAERRSGDERREGRERREDIRFDAGQDRRTGKQRRKEDYYTWHTTI